MAQIAMTHEPTVRAVQEEFGGRVQRVQQSRYNTNARDRFDWRLSDSAAVEFLRSIRPWLITKAAAVDLALSFPGGTRGRVLTDALLGQREDIRLAMKEANRRGR